MRFPRQQKSFGQKRRKRGGQERGQDIAIFAEAGAMSVRSGAKGCSPGFLRFARYGLERKEASLLTSIFVSFDASKEKESMRQLSIRGLFRPL
ncbi:hypothetical protein [uncultured Mucilaginibacter sp.]|uniref:hypothetical protein n=1 Tax=uncultured Mucilaginibacter sp. TaxID=797541 RepID=UPI0025F8149A|nr:hypothetical protein [uncultured Mucilaginibacter sp.]